MKKIDVEADYEVWKEYAYQAGIHPAILAYLEIRKEYFYRMETTVDGKAFVTARGWEDLSQLLKVNEELGKEFLTKGNYKNYIGSIYIDTVNSIYQDTIQIVLGCVFAIFFVVYFISYMIHNRNLNKFKKDTVLWGKIKTELDSSNIIEHSKLSLYLGKNMIIDYSKKLNILNYQDIAWVYLHENKYNGITNLRYLMVVLKNNKKIQIAYVGGFHPKLKEEYVKVMEEIYQHNQTILIGYTKENREQIKKLNKNK